MPNDLSLARKLIKECQETQHPELDLGNCGIGDLNDLPELFECLHLETLILNTTRRENVNGIFQWEMTGNKGSPNSFFMIPSQMELLQSLRVLSICGGKGGKVSAISFLKNLSNLTSLDLTGNEISDFHCIENLTGLQSLYVAYNGISDFTFLEKLIGIQSLDIRFNSFSDNNCLDSLVALKFLNISQNSISNLYFLESLNKLQSLDIGQNNISEIQVLENLIELKSLDFSHNEIDVIDAIGELTTLRSLNINFNNVIDGSPLKNLRELCSFSNLGNKIVDYSFLKNLTELQDLSVGSLSSDYAVLDNLTKLENLNFYIKDKELDYSFLEKFPNLQSLDITNNNISDYSFLEKLPRLVSLTLGNSKITGIDFLKNLTSLEYLSLSYNKISDISFLKSLTRLEYLDLQGNKISNISSLEYLTDLKYLNLSNNYVSNLQPLGNLKKLESLDLRSNDIMTVPLSIFRIGMKLSFESDDLDGLFFIENPINSPPPEIILQGNDSIFDWFKATKKTLNEIKIILIGDPKAGKTSLLRRFKDGSFKHNEPQTDGINIEDIKFGECKTFKKQPSLHKLTAHFWDFGGQEIMNATHQFFLTNRSMYLLVLDARKDNDVAGQVKQWVKRVKATGGNSPIIVIVNQADINPGFDFSNASDLQKEFPEIKYFIKVSCKTGLGIDQIKERMQELIPQAELFNTEIDERWIAIKEQLQEETKLEHYLDETSFEKICGKHGLHDEAGRLNAIKFFNDLGLLLHFEELKLAQYYVLDPYWITYGVYRIVTSGEAGRLKGIVPMDRLKYIVNEEVDKKDIYRLTYSEKILYDTNQRRFLVDILNQFKLCFYLPGDSGFIIPNLLEATEPIAVTEPLKSRRDSIRFVYKYEYLPNSVLPNIMVAAHPLLGEKWRTGCILKGNDCRALVSAYQDVLTITVNGEGNRKREFMAVTRHCIDTINQGLAVKPQMLVPLPNITPTAYAEYEVLLNRDRKGRKDFIYNEDKPGEKAFEISVLLEGIAKPDELKLIMEGILDLQDSMVELKTMLNVHYQYLIQRLGDDNIDGKIIEAIREIDDAQTADIKREILERISDAFEIFSGSMDGKLKAIYNDLKKTDNLEMKLKLSIPFLNLLGIELGTEVTFDVKSWAIKMYKKHKLRIFELLGAFPASE